MKETSRQAESVPSGHVLPLYLIVLVTAGALYIVTCAPAILWQDSGRFVYRVWHNDIQGKFGLALAHPLYIMIGIGIKHIPIGDLAYRVNLISAVFGAVAVANIFLLLRLWLGKSVPAVIAAVTLALSHTFWFHASIAETYTLYIALLTGELIMLLRYTQSKRVGYLYWLGLLNGLAIADHMFALISLLCYGVFFVILLVKKHIGFGHLVIVILFWIVGAAPYEFLVIKNIIQSGDFTGTVLSAVFGNSWQKAVINTSISTKMVWENMIFILLNFPTPNLVFFFIGLWALWKVAPSRGFANIIVAMLVLYFVFAFRYTVLDRHVFFLPFYCLMVVLIGVGANAFFNRSNRKAAVVAVLLFSLLPIPVYAVTPALARKTYKIFEQRRQRPYRDEYTYWLWPWKTGYRGAERFANEALDMVEENAIIYAYTTDVHTLLYVQEVKGKRADVKIVSDYDSSKDAPAFDQETIVQLMNSSVVYTSSAVKGYCPEFLFDNYDFVQTGVLWRVVGKARNNGK
jgi:hypothetical protein